VLSLVRVEIGTAVALLTLIVYTIFVATSNCLESFLRAERRLKWVVGATLFEKSVMLTIVAFVTSMHLGIWAIGIAYLTAGVVRMSFVSFIIFVKQRVPLLVPKFRHVREFVLKGIPFAFNTVALNVIPRLDTLVIALVSATSAGYFALGDRVIGPALIVPFVASSTLYPFLAREDSNSMVAWKISGGMMAIGVVGAVVGALLSPIVVPAVFGGGYESAVPVVQLMLFAIPLVYASGPLLAHLYTSGRERQLLAATLVASIIGTAAVLLGQVLIGASGAAVGYVLRYALFAIALTAIGVRRREPTAGRDGVDSQPGWLIGNPAPRE
jgi:O-antigen/teichoic acid export membrane protein